MSPRGSLDGAVFSQGGREWIAHEEQDDDGSWDGWMECGTCGSTVRGGDDARTDHVCGPRCPECDAPADEAKIVTREHDDGSRSKTWNCCGETVRCPGCGGEAVVVLRHSDEIGAYCTRCPWTES